MPLSPQRCFPFFQEIGKLFLLVDENHDDTISWDEFIVASHAGKLLNIWKKLDKNHDGRVKQFKRLYFQITFEVDSHEWGHAVGILWEEMSSIFGGKSKREVGEIFNSIDVNNDLTISWDEILNAFYLVTHMRWNAPSFFVKGFRIQIHSIRKDALIFSKLIKTAQRFNRNHFERSLFGLL